MYSHINNSYHPDNWRSARSISSDREFPGATIGEDDDFEQKPKLTSANRYELDKEKELDNYLYSGPGSTPVIEGSIQVTEYVSLQVASEEVRIKRLNTTTKTHDTLDTAKTLWEWMDKNDMPKPDLRKLLDMAYDVVHKDEKKA